MTQRPLFRVFARYPVTQHNVLVWTNHAPDMPLLDKDASPPTSIEYPGIQREWKALLLGILPIVGALEQRGVCRHRHRGAC